MRSQISGTSDKYKFPTTQVHSLLDDQLLIFLRSWNGIDANQKIIDEINHFLSAANADLEVTTPFDFIENLSSLANKVRISTLLANDIIYKTENKEKYLHGYELAIIFKNQQEIAWSTVGRFEIQAVKNQKSISISHGGQFLDDQILLPVSLLGIEREPAVSTGSIAVKNLDQMIVSSAFDQQSTYWKAVIQDFT
jgi:hypothetical protein